MRDSPPLQIQEAGGGVSSNQAVLRGRSALHGHKFFMGRHQVLTARLVNDHQDRPGPGEQEVPHRADFPAIAVRAGKPSS
jgi:hypothetical protein